MQGRSFAPRPTPLDNRVVLSLAFDSLCALKMYQQNSFSKVCFAEKTPLVKVFNFNPLQHNCLWTNKPYSSGVMLTHHSTEVLQHKTEQFKYFTHPGEDRKLTKSNTRIWTGVSEWLSHKMTGNPRPCTLAWSSEEGIPKMSSIQLDPDEYWFLKS